MHDPVQEIPSQNPSSTLEAMKAAQNNAISTNEKIFPVFAQKLASGDVKEFVNTVRKLAMWLRSERAYYAAAQSKIVELLEIALLSFKNTFVRHPAIAELAEHLRQLVQAVMPFRHLFSEPELQSRLQRVILDPRLSLTRAPTSTTSASPQNEVVPANLFPTVVSPVDAPPMVPPVSDSQSSVSRPQVSLAYPSAVGRASDGAMQVVPPRASGTSEATPLDDVETVSSLAPPVPSMESMDTSPNENSPISLAVLSKPQPKRARRAIELSEELVARDLDWFKSNQSSAIANHDRDAPASTAGEPSLVLASDAPNVPGQPPTPKKKSARMVPSRRLPRRMTLDDTRGVNTGFSAPMLTLSEPSGENRGYNPQVLSIKTNVDEQTLPQGQSDSGNTEKGLRPEDASLPELESVSAPVNVFIEPQTHQNPFSAERSFTNSRTFISPPFPQAVSEGLESKDMSISESATSSPPPAAPCKTEPSLSQTPLVFELPGPALPRFVEPPLNLDFRISQKPSGHPLHSVIGTNRQRFDGKMAVIHSTLGKPFTHTHTIDIPLSEIMFSKIVKWANRKAHPLDASQGVCISLGCYRLPGLFDVIKPEDDKLDVVAFTSRSPCSWPPSNQLSLHVKDDKRHTVITLSPPLFLTPDQCVDLSSLVKPGNNRLEFRQLDDLSEYLLVLHAHRPTQAQLGELEVVKTADERWKRFLDVISGRDLGWVASNGSAGVVRVS